MRAIASLPVCVLSCLLGLLPGAARAHDPIPADWCLAPDTRPVAVSTFALTPEQLEAYKRRRLAEDDGRPCVGERSCGIVDDWHWANEQAGEICASGNRSTALSSSTLSNRTLSNRTLSNLAPSNLAPSNRAIPIVTAPQSFLGLSHHDEYRFGHGLSGMCVACPTSLPATTAQPATIASDRP